MKNCIYFFLFLLFINRPALANSLQNEIETNKNYISLKDSAIYNITGVIISKNKNVLKLKIDSISSIFPTTNQTALLSKYFDNTIGKMHVTGWLDIANIKIVAKRENILNVMIEKELSITYINGEKKNHFKSGTQIKITWYEAE